MRTAYLRETSSEIIEISAAKKKISAAEIFSFAEIRKTIKKLRFRFALTGACATFALSTKTAEALLIIYGSLVCRL